MGMNLGPAFGKAVGMGLAAGAKATPGPAGRLLKKKKKLAPGAAGAAAASAGAIAGQVMGVPGTKAPY